MIASYDQLTAALANAQPVRIYKTGGSSLAEAAGEFSSLWTVTGRPTAGVAPSAGLNGEALTNTKQGAMPFTNPTGAAQKYLARANLIITTVGTVGVYDRLWQNSGIVWTQDTVQAIAAPVALPPRDENGSTDGVGVFPWLEIYTTSDNTTTGTAGTISYTNSDGVAGRTGTIATIPATALTTTVMPIALQAGDVGVRSIQSITLGTRGTTTLGAAGLVLARDINDFPLSVANAGPAYGWDVAAAKIHPNSCLALRLLNTGTTRGHLYGIIALIDG